MKVNEIVRRTLADAALRGERRWNNLADIAFASRCSVTSVHAATRRLLNIGALQKFGRGGLSVIDPERVTTTLAVERNLQRDTLATTTRDAAQRLLSTLDVYALGGTIAAIHHLGGQNTVADPGQRLVYVPTCSATEELPLGDEVLIPRMDDVAQDAWRDGYASIAGALAIWWAVERVFRGSAMDPCR